MLKQLIFILLFLLFNFPLFAQNQKSDDYDNIARQFILELSREEFSTAYDKFDKTVKSQFKLEQFGTLWEMLKIQHGDFETIISVEGKNYLDNRLVFVKASFKNSDLKFRIFINDKGLIAGFFIDEANPKKPYAPPDYSDSSRITEIETEFGDPEFLLSGVITIPKDKKEYPLLILVHGSGPQDKDESIGPNKIFKDIALGLATNGIAVFRYEKRTKQHGSKLSPNITIDIETIDDAVFAIEHIKSKSNINAKKIFLLGHSLGGYAAPKIAEKAKSLSGIILMGANISPLEDLILMQVRHLSSLKGKPSEKEMLEIEELAKQVVWLKRADLNEEIVKDSLPLGMPISFWASIRNYDPAETAMQIPTAMLILQAEMDYQVPVSEFEIWKKRLAGRKDTQFKEFQGLNHLFIKSSGTMGYEEYFTQANVSYEVIKSICDWIFSN